MTENERLKFFRKSIGLTQKELAASMNMTQGGYSEVERGVKGVSGKLSRKLLEVYHLSLNWLAIGYGDMKLPKDVFNKEGKVRQKEYSIDPIREENIPLIEEPLAEFKSDSNYWRELYFAQKDQVDALSKQNKLLNEMLERHRKD